MHRKVSEVALREYIHMLKERKRGEHKQVSDKMDSGQSDAVQAAQSAWNEAKLKAEFSCQEVGELLKSTIRHEGENAELSIYL
tara:strand:- start:248 stop:496 length:249 start_codon:yes stop_codon:yes gene_type:complete